MDHTAMTYSWNWDLVALSYVIAVFASYTALNLAGRVVATRGLARNLWLAGGAFAMGTGIWSMHFTGMLAFEMGMPVSYYVPTTLLSVVIAVAASGLALFVVNRGLVGIVPLLVAGPVMGVGIASMHYTGMAAMHMAATISYDPLLFTLSVLIAIVASIIALYLFFRLNRGYTPWARALKGAAAIVMGTAIVGMHYTGMAAATFTWDSREAAPSYDLNTPALGFGIGVFTLLILALALVSVIVDRRWSVTSTKLEESNERFRLLVEGVKDYAILMLDPEGRVASWNQGAQRIKGYSPEEILGRHFSVFYPEEDVEGGKPEHELEVAEAEGAYEEEGWRVRKDGSRFWANVLITALKDEEGRLRGFSKVTRDVTERKRAGEKLQEQQDFLRRIIDTAPNLVFVKDWDGKFTLVNKALADIYGTTNEELIGKSDADFNSNEEEVKAFLRADRDVMYSQQSKFIPEEPVTDVRTGKTRWFQTTKVPLVSSSGESRRVLGIATDITERKRAEERLKHQALHDPLTGLPNRVLFADRLEHAIARTERQESCVAVLFVDLDNFKVVNDSLGHEAGDRLLTEAGNRLAAYLRSRDTLARFGGDEFAILLEDITDGSQATLVAERITEGLRAPFVLDDREIVVSASIGIVLSTASLEDPTHLLRSADVALYRAKSRGKAGYAVFDPEMNIQAYERLDLEANLRRAIEREEFVIYYQPKVKLATGKVIGAEALVRWEHPERGLMLPDKFIPVAEETGLIRPIGWWVLREACWQAREWQEEHFSDFLLMSVNLSAVQLRHPRFVEEVEQVLEETGVNPDTLVLEITESMMMEDAESSVATLRRLKGLGVRLAVDDFGTGYSSLDYLKRFPIDLLKVDRSFIDGLGKEPGDTAIVRAVIGLSRALDLELVAEGIETTEQLSRLQTLGCELGQGYYFAKPLPGIEMEARLDMGYAVCGVQRKSSTLPTKRASDGPNTAYS